MKAIIVLLFAHALFVWGKSVQQRNVVLDSGWVQIGTTSLFMGLCEVYVVSGIIKATSLDITGSGLLITGLALGLGGFMGAMTGIYTHRFLKSMVE